MPRPQSQDFESMLQSLHKYMRTNSESNNHKAGYCKRLGTSRWTWSNGNALIHLWVWWASWVCKSSMILIYISQVSQPQLRASWISLRFETWGEISSTKLEGQLLRHNMGCGCLSEKLRSQQANDVTWIDRSHKKMLRKLVNTKNETSLRFRVCNFTQGFKGWHSTPDILVR